MEISTAMTDIVDFNTDSFSHGQILSKIWLCQELEPYLADRSSMAILGCWYNTLALILRARNNNHKIVGYDIDSGAVSVANRICDSWCLDNSVQHEIADVNTVNLDQFDVVINTSSEHMSTQWFKHVRAGTLVCIQSSSVVDPGQPWLVSNPSPTFDDFLNKYPMSSELFTGQKFFDYVTWSYHRFMLLGIK
jgi:16S rRNA G1207 methylase RsmC